MKTVAGMIGVSRSNLIERLQERPKTRIGRPPPWQRACDRDQGCHCRATDLGYRCVHAVLTRRALAAGNNPPNHKHGP
jgi:hypothetical protein